MLTPPGRRPLSDADIHAFLYYGAAFNRADVRGGGPLLRGVETADLRRWAAGATDSALVREAAHRLNRAADEALDAAGGGPHAVQLSGGYDSRTVLGALRDRLDVSEIATLTFGIPGAADVEIARQIARHVGTRHTELDVRDIAWSPDAVVEYVATAFAERPAALAVRRYTNYRLRETVGASHTFWVGFLACVGGSQLSAEPSPTWQAAVDRFTRRARHAKSVALAPSGWDPRSVFPDAPPVEPAAVSMDDQLDFAYRQARLIEIPWSRYRDAYLLAQKPFVDFMLALPHEKRAGKQTVYRAMIARLYPDLAAFEAQGGRPPLAGFGVTAPARTLRRVRRGLRRRLGRTASEYMRYDYAENLRGESDHRQTAWALTHGLVEREVVPHLDVPRLWADHTARVADHSRALMLLASLEANLRAMDTVSGSLPPPDSRPDVTEDNAGVGPPTDPTA